MPIFSALLLCSHSESQNMIRIRPRKHEKDSKHPLHGIASTRAIIVPLEMTKCPYEIGQSKLKTELFDFLKSKATISIDINDLDIRRKISKCNIFFARCLLKYEMNPYQYMEIVHATSDLQGHILDVLVLMSGQDRKEFFSFISRCGYNLIDLFILHKKRQSSTLPNKCSICSYKKRERQISVRNGNTDISNAKEHAVLWKSMNDLPSTSKMFSFHVDDMHLSINFSDDAKSYLFETKDMPIIDFHVSHVIHEVLFRDLLLTYDTFTYLGINPAPLHKMSV